MPNRKPPSDQPSNPTVLRIPPTRPISAIVGYPPKSSVSAGLSTSEKRPKSVASSDQPAHTTKNTTLVAGKAPTNASCPAVAPPVALIVPDWILAGAIPHPLVAQVQPGVEGFDIADFPRYPVTKTSRVREEWMAEYHWTGGDLPNFVTHLECSLTRERYSADTLQTLSKAGRPLLVRYDLDGVRRALPREALAGRPQSLWRYRELLPVRRPENVVSLGEVMTPLIPLPRIAARLAKGGEILVKDEGGCRPAPSRRAAWRSRCRWPRSSGSTRWRCRPTAMPGRRWRRIAREPASNPTSSARTIPRRSTSARSRCRVQRCSWSTG